ERGAACAASTKTLRVEAALAATLIEAFRGLIGGFDDLASGGTKDADRSPAMRMDRLTTKSQEALRAAVDVATRRGNPELIPEHILVAILEQEGGVGSALVERAGARARELAADLGERIDKLPRVSGGAEPSFGRRTTPFLNQAEDEAKRLKDDYVSVEHFLLAGAKGDKDVQAI